MKKFHLSHTDLDGFGCQTITNAVPGNWSYYNSGYGNQIREKLELILSEAEEGDYILITDLNLTMDIALWIDEEVNKRGLVLELLDHHGTGKAVAEKYDWYHLDESICATTITYNRFQEEIHSKEYQLILDDFQKVVNVYDLWKEHDDNFHIGKMMSQMLYRGFKFPQELASDKALFNIFVLSRVACYLKPGFTIAEIESRQYNIHKAFFEDKISKEDFENEKHTLEDRLNIFIYQKFLDFDLPIIEIDGIKLKLFFNTDGGVFQNVSHMFLRNDDKSFDACINVKKDGALSIRSKDPINVSNLAVKYFNGGGHPQACGGFLGDKNSNKKYKREEVIEILKSLS